MDGPAFTIAGAETTADLADVARLFRAYADGLGVDLGYQGFERELAGLPGSYAPPAGALLLARAESDGSAIGCVGVRPAPRSTSPDSNGPASWCEMKRLYVTPAARGLGLGRALMDAAIAAAGLAGYREIRLDTLPSMTAAIAMYRAAGFTATPPYYDGAPAGTLFLARPIA